MSSVKSDIGRYAIVPEWLLDEDVSDAAIRLFAVLAAKHADRGDGSSVVRRNVLADEMKKKSVSPVDRAKRELLEVGALTAEPRFADDGSRLADELTVHFSLPGGRVKTTGGGHENLTAKNQNQFEPEKRDIKRGSLFNTGDTNHPEQEGGSSSKDSARAVFDHWASVMPHKRAPKFTPDRRSKIEARLAEGYTVEDCTAAIDGCTTSDWHMGRAPENDVQRGGKLYIGIDLIFRNGGKLEEFRNMGAPSSGPSPDQIRDDRMMLTTPEMYEHMANKTYPFDEASERTVKAAGR